MKVGYARVSTQRQDLTAQLAALEGMGVAADRIYTDHGLTGRNREREGLRQALAACRAGDELVVTKLDRLGRSAADLRSIIDELFDRGVGLNVGGSVQDPSTPLGRMFLSTLAMFAEFESDLIRQRTRDGMAMAKAAGRLRGRDPKLNARQRAHLYELHIAGAHSARDLADLFGISRATVYRTIDRERSQEKA